MITLYRTVPVTCIDLAATVSVSRDLPHYMPLIRLAKDFGGAVTVKQVHRELFQTLPEHFARLALARCKDLGVLEEDGDQRYRLTERGDLALETGKILTPEEGVWRFYLADDPLLPCPVIHLKRIETSSLHQDVSSAKGGSQKKQSKVLPAPDYLKRWVDKTPQSSFVDGTFWVITAIEGKGAGRAQDTLRLDLRWGRGEAPQTLLTGKLPESGGTIDYQFSPAVGDWTCDDLWRVLVGQETGVKASDLLYLEDLYKDRVVPVAFDDLPEQQRRTFRQDLSIPGITLSRLGRFEPSTLPDVRIVPAADQDAQDWCEWLQWDAVTTYVTPALLQRQADAVLDKFPYHDPRPLEPVSMLAQARQAPGARRARNILTPADLGLWS